MNLISKAKSFYQTIKSFTELRRYFSGAQGTGSSSSRPTRPYAQSELVYACVNKLVDAISGLPLILSTIDNKIVESGPAYDFLFNNPKMKYEDLINQVVGHYALTRDVFIVFTEMNGLQPTEMMVVSGMQMHAITHNRRADGTLVGWEFRGVNGERATFKECEVYQIKNFNPYSRFHGLGPVTAARLAISQSYQASLLNESALANGASLGTVLTAPGKVDPDQARFLLDQFDTRHAGAGKAKRTALIAGGMDIKQTASKLADIEMTKLKDMNDKRICTTFNVPPAVVGLETEAQYSGGPAQRDFVCNSVTPLARVIAGHLTNMISGMFQTGTRAVELKDCKTVLLRNYPLVRRQSYRAAHLKAVQRQSRLFFWFNTDAHPVIQEMQNEKTEKVLNYKEAGVTLNNLIEVYDLPFDDDQPWGKEHWVSMGLVPASYILEAGPEGITGPDAPEGEDDDPDDDEGGDEDSKSIADKYASKLRKLFAPPESKDEDGKSDIKKIVKLLTQPQTKDDERAKLRFWKNWVISWAGIEREYKGALWSYFQRQQRLLIAALKKALKEAKSVTKDKDEIIARVVFDLHAENKKLKVINQVFFGKASELGIRQTLTEGGVTGDQLDAVVEQVKLRPAVRRALRISSQKITKTNKTTRKMIADQLTEGLENGEDLNQLTDRIKTQLGSNRARHLKIARTHTSGAVSAGRQEGMKAVGGELKSWITSRDDHVRDAHKSAEAKYDKGIPITEHFDVGGEMLMYPGDPSASAKNIMNCRCLHIMMAAAGKSLGLAYYANIKFYSYDDMIQAHLNAKGESDG
ncbi:MAG: phage portal protein [Planctomycetes bacterium]|nr:phage portal protein [Planctomycetota bacterium]